MGGGGGGSKCLEKAKFNIFPPFPLPFSPPPPPPNVFSMAKELVRGVHHVEEAIVVPLLVVDLIHGGGHAR